jgi:hypothetical protein
MSAAPDTAGMSQLEREVTLSLSLALSLSLSLSSLAGASSGLPTYPVLFRNSEQLLFHE